MNEILEKLSSYNIFNYLLPGILFSFAAESLTQYDVVQDDVLVGVFLYYFIGLVISRIGSIIIEPILKKIKFIEFAQYDKYIAAVKHDTLIETLSESNNMYRTIISMLTCLLTLLIFEKFTSDNQFLVQITPYVLIALLLLLFLFSYKKQTNYIVKRVNLFEKK